MADDFQLIADISLWQLFRSTGYPPKGTSQPDVDEALGRIIDRARKHMILVPAPQEVLDALDEWLEAEQPDGFETSSDEVSRADKYAIVREYRRALDDNPLAAGEADTDPGALDRR